ncbi:MAG TPA: beta-galactosidase [Clostridia bacterium]|nr:hypothetical protein [Clostridiaceae bacterium]HPZ52863.1 beta-galactosidase [Clostridia bacterium]
MKYTPPFYGSAYYPESWPKEKIKEDIALMKEMGMNVARIGEFAWSNMEPKEGKYDFSFMLHVVSELDKEGIATIMGTPTCTPPAWLTQKHPEVMIVNSHGVRETHGARRHACPNNPVYREYTRKIVTNMAQAFKDCDSIIGWQIDNELYNNGNDGRGCCCNVCYGKFLEYLKEKYETLENLNRTWGMYVWSLNYTEWEQIPIPRNNVWHHPSYLTEWMLFQARSYKEYCDFQADILHEYLPEDVPVGTDMMPFLGLDYEDMNEKLDVVQFNYYRFTPNLWDIALWADYMYNVLDKPFWITETATCWGGGVACTWHNDENLCIANTMLPVILGSNANLYWLWRNHFAGQELMHGSVVNSHGRPMHIANEVKHIASSLRKLEDMINNTYPKRSEIAMHISHHAWTLYMFQPMVNGFDYYNAFTGDVFKPLMESQLRSSVISEGMDLSKYKVVITSFVPHIERKELNKRILEWVKEGGTWIAGPMTDIRTYVANKYMAKPFGMLEDVTGTRLAFTLPGGRKYTAVSDSGEVLEFKENANSFDAYEADESTKVLYKYREGYLKDYAAITETKVGKGRIILLGSMPAPESFAGFIKAIAQEEGINPFDASGNVVVQIRKNTETDEDEYLACVEVTNMEGYITAIFDCVDVIDGSTYKKGERIIMAPFSFRVLRKI